MTLVARVRAGEIPDSVMQVAGDEGLEPELIAARISMGTIVIPVNDLRGGLKSVGIGQGLTTKVNANIGTSEHFASLDDECEKLKVALDKGAHAVMDLSTGGDLNKIRKKLLELCTVPFGTVPIYQAVIEAEERRGSVGRLKPGDLFDVIEQHVRDGVDFVTVHCGVTRDSLQALEEAGRVTGIVSRGGAFLAGWMMQNDAENPLYEDFGRLLEIAHKHDVTLSLGDGMRPGCQADAGDRAQVQELLALGKLVDQARQAEVQVIVEGPGHMPLNEIEAHVRLEKSVCRGAPFYLLGPLVTDIAPGFDHIAGAIGGAVAAAAGADFLCYVTPREHLGLPTVDDVAAGVIASRIAGHAADIAQGVGGVSGWDLEMSKARKKLDWQGQFELAVDPDTARRLHHSRAGAADTCTMCGEYCSMHMLSEFESAKKTTSRQKPAP